MKIKTGNETIGYIYMITNPNGRIYVGSTYDVYTRWLKYKNLSCQGQIKLYRSLIKYGVDNHIFEIVWAGDINDMLKYETMIGTYYDVLSKTRGMNLKLPKIGEIYQTIGEETRERMSKAQTGRKHSEETKNKQSISKIGKARSQETKDKLKLAHIGKKASDETKKKMSLKKGKKILQYSLDGTFVKEWKSGAEIARFFNKSSESVLACCRGVQKSSAGFIWRFEAI